jgi:hypothetical protein
MNRVAAILSLVSILFSLSALSQGSQSCWNYRDESGLKVCKNDKVKVIRNGGSRVLAGPFKVIGLEDSGVVVLQYVSSSGRLGFTRKAVAELDVIVFENRHFDSEVKIGDQVVRSRDSKVFEVTGLGADGLVGIKIGSDLDLFLFASEYTKLSN